MSGTNKFKSILNQMSMKFHSKLGEGLRSQDLDRDFRGATRGVHFTPNSASSLII